jgi:hypothetical protein
LELSHDMFSKRELHRQVVNLNSREKVDKLMEQRSIESMKLELNEYRRLLNESFDDFRQFFVGSHAHHPCMLLNFPNFDRLVLCDEISWIDSDVPVSPPAWHCAEANKLDYDFIIEPTVWLQTVTSPTLEFFQSAAVSLFIEVVNDYRYVPECIPILEELLL